MTSRQVVRLGTLDSKLAVAQGEFVAEQLRRASGCDVELVNVETGDQVDFTVRTLADVPATLNEGFALVAVTPRGDARDALVARDGLTLGELPPDARVGTTSVRVSAQLNTLGLGVEAVQIDDSVETALARVGVDLDAVIVPRAALDHLGRTDEITESIDPLQMLPAPGQGALALECRADDDATIHLLRMLDDPDTRAAVTAERSLLATLEAGSTGAVGALAEIVLGETGDELWLRATLSDPSGSPTIRSSITGLPEQAAHVGQQLAVELLSEGADPLVGAP